VGGYSPDGLDTLAMPVDGVLGEQLERLKSTIEKPLLRFKRNTEIPKRKDFALGFPFRFA
jgi:hypothetical protein